MKKIIIYLFFINSFLNAFEIKFIEKFNFNEHYNIFENSKSFCITEDEVFILPDYKNGNIKLFNLIDSKINLIDSFGRKGYKKDEFLGIILCNYDVNLQTLIIYDEKIRKIFLYERIKQDFFKYKNEFSHFEKIFCISFLNNKPIFSISKNGKYFLKYFYHGKNYVLTELNNNGKILFDIIGDEIYFIQNNKLKIGKINFFSGKIEKFFGLEPPHFNSSSQIRNISIIKNRYVFLIYQNMNKLYMQFYTLDGEFILERDINNNFDEKIFFNKSNNFLYLIKNKELLKYKIIKI